MSLEFTVNVRPNREIITPLEFGDITYDYPSTYTTDKISEIVVINAPLNFSRYGALFGKPSDVTFQMRRQAPINNSLVQNGDTTSTFTAPPSSVLVNNDNNTFFDPSITTAALRPKSINTDLLNPQASIYYPQLDFYPRYNQWFASTSWPRPFNNTFCPQYYDVMLVYADRESRTIYYKYGTANFAVIDAEPLNIDNSSIVINSQSAVDANEGGGSLYKKLTFSANFTAPTAGTYELKWTYTATYTPLNYGNITPVTQTYVVSTIRSATAPGNVAVTHVKGMRDPVQRLPNNDPYPLADQPSIVGSPILLTVTSEVDGSIASKWFTVT